MKYDFEEKCRGGWVRAAKVRHGAAMRIEPDIGMAWDGSLLRWDATTVADMLEGASASPVKVGLDDMSVRRTVFGAEIAVTGVMVHSKVEVQLDHGQTVGLAKCLRHPPPPASAWNSGADRRRDRLMRGMFG